MARIRRDLAPEAPSRTLPDHLGRFVFEHWAESAGAAHGILGEYTAAESRWGSALREWARDHDATLGEARALVTEPPNWNGYRRRVSESA